MVHKLRLSPFRGPLLCWARRLDVVKYMSTLADCQLSRQFDVRKVQKCIKRHLSVTTKVTTLIATNEATTT